MTGGSRPTARPRARWSVLAILGGVLLVIVRLFAAGSRVHLPNTPPPPARFLVTGTPCSIDANADGVADVAARVMERGSTDLVVGLDGRNGRELWRVPAVDADRMFCAGPHALVLMAKGGGGRAISPAGGATLAPLRVDSVETVAGGADCFVLVRADQLRTAFDTRGAPVVRCDAATAPSSMGVVEALFTSGVHVGDATVTARAGAGDASLVLSGASGGAPPWRVDVPVEIDRRALTFAFDSKGIFVVGHPVGKDGEPHAVYVNAADGAIKYDEALLPTSNGTAAFAELAVDPNDRVLLHYDGKLVVLDAATGTIVWSLGG